MALVIKNPPADAGDKGDAGSMPGSGRSPGGGHGNPLQYSCLEKSMNRGDWQVTSMGLPSTGHDWSHLTWHSKVLGRD